MVLVTAMIGQPASPKGRTDQRSEPQSTASTDPGFRRPHGWVIARLNRTVMTDEILPELAHRHFPRNEGQSYRLAVVDIDDHLNQVYPASGLWSAADLKSYDYAIDLFGYSTSQPLRTRTLTSVAGTDAPGRPGGPPRQFEVPGLQQAYTPLGHRWRLLVKNEAGSLEAAVEQIRLRNLGVSFGVFLVLSAAAFMIVFTAQRTRALGKLHMEFAAGVSHELRTPLAVIRTAAYNLRSGVVRDPTNVEQYGAIVQKEERRLSGMVEQLMAYAETQAGRRRFDITAVDVTDIVDQALKSLVWGDVEVKIERRIPADLPPALADSDALSQCLQNLISNSIKYGQRGGAVEIDIEAVANPTDHTIRLAVMDRGNGVPARDVAHLFEPFHRGSNTGPATPGNGIGLHLVRKTIEAQNGAVTYEDRPGGGAVFVLTLPSVQPNA
jgi:signal transduction histidine kinase